MNSTDIRWRRHPTTGKFHAYEAPDRPSICGWTYKATGEGQREVPPWPDACWRCCKKLGVRTTGTRPTEPEEMRVEFDGGPLDGVRLWVPVVRLTATQFRLIGGTFRLTKPPVRASEVEQPVSKEIGGR